MIDLPSAPSQLLKTITGLAHAVWLLLLIFWLVFLTAWGILYGVIVPRIGEFRPYLEARASHLLGAPVRIGSLTAHTVGMMPSFELAQVQLFDPQGREALRLPRVLVALSPRSVLRLGFEQLYMDQPELNVRRSKDGKITVAGLDFSKHSSEESAAAEWFFSQLEFAIHEGTLHWTDEMRAAPTLALQHVNLVVRNRGRHHALRLDATPPAQWGERFSIKGEFMQPFLSRSRARWQDWQGQLYAGFEHVDVSELRRYADIGVDLTQGRGALRAWADISHGQWVSATADVALSQVSVTLNAGLQALELASVQGRLAGRALATGFEFSTQALQFETRDGLHWPGGNVSMMYLGPDGSMPARGEFKADRLDLAALRQIANRLPLDASTRATMLAFAPKGLVDRIQARWQGPLAALTHYEVKGLASQLAWSAPASGGVPGVQGALVDFDFNQSSGKARVSLSRGAVEVPGFLEDPVVAFNQLSTDIKWQVNAQRIAVQLPNLKFSNADAQGEAQVKWETADPGKNSLRARLPGVLDLQATLSRANGVQVYRYLPTAIQPAVREYLRDAIQAGTLSNVRFKVKGDLHNLLATDPKKGEFKVSAYIQNATFAYVPRKLQRHEALPWPVLTQLSGELLIDRTQLQIKNAHTRLGSNSGIQVSQLEALIPDVSRDATVTVNAQARGALSDLLETIHGSPLGNMTAQALSHTVATGSADYKLKLVLPIHHVDATTLQGSVTLANNDIQIVPKAPKLLRSRGVVDFSEHGFSVVGGQARMLGGEIRLEGGSVPGSHASRLATSLQFRASGTASAEGLRQARELGFIARMAQHASGSAAYTAVLGFRRGEPELSISSNLQGMALSLPAPLNKSAESVQPLRLETALVHESLLPGPGGQVALQDQLTLDLGRLASMVYVRDISGSEPRVLRGSLGVGLTSQESAPLPDEGVAANINVNALDLDAWGAVLSQASGTSLKPGAEVPALSLGYVPTRIAVRADELTVAGRKLHHVVVGGSREGLLWRANLDATELNGYVEYRQPSDTGAGRVYARLARLTIAPHTASEVEALLDEQPETIPALDIVVEHFELRGKSLGRVEVEAINRGAGWGPREGGAREWRLNKFNVITPEAVLTATGNWTAVGAVVPHRGAELRRTALNFKLEIAQAGELLARLGMKGVVRRGRGKMEGQVQWRGSPLSLDYASMGGAFTVNVESGQFLKADPGIAKLLGVLSLQSLPRRLALDFRDVFSEGFSFDFVRGDVDIEQGIAKTRNLQMKGVNATVLMEGQADLSRETQDIKVLVVPEVNAGTASLIASIINPAVGIGTFLAQLILQRPLSDAATQEFHIDGTWADPRITQLEHSTAAEKGKPDTRPAMGKEGGQ